MDPTEQNDEIIRKLLYKSDDLKLPTNTVFLVGPSDDLEEFIGAELIELVRADAFSRIFSDESGECEEIEEIRVLDLNSGIFVNLLK